MSDSDYLGIGASETAKSIGSSGYIGRFTPADWWICTIGALLLPALALWWFAG